MQLHVSNRPDDRRRAKWHTNCITDLLRHCYPIHNSQLYAYAKSNGVVYADPVVQPNTNAEHNADAEPNCDSVCFPDTNAKLQ